jgi:hypothetical protein
MKLITLIVAAIALSDPPTEIVACGTDHACPAGWYAVGYVYVHECGTVLRIPDGMNATRCQKAP